LEHPASTVIATTKASEKVFIAQNRLVALREGIRTHQQPISRIATMPASL
jgi:hypothetical protein